MILSIANQKGGVGKTTTSISLAAALARQGKKTLLIDVDYQANATEVLYTGQFPIRPEETLHVTLIGRKPLPIHPTKVPNLDLVPGHIYLSNTDVELTTAKDHREERLKRHLDPIQSNYEFVILDCPPSLGWLTLNAFAVSNRVLIVVSPGRFEIAGLAQLQNAINDVQLDYNPDIKIAGFLFTKSAATVASRTTLQLLRQAYTDLVLTTVIPANTAQERAHFNQEDIFAYDPDSPAAQAYTKLMDELFHI